MENIVLKVERINKSFAHNKILDDISLDIVQGEIFGVIGASGSGKTTLLNLIIGFIEPTSGKVLIKSKSGLIPIFNNMDYVKKTVGFAAQHPSFYDKLTVSENLDYFGTLYNLSEEARLNNAKTLLELVELSHAKDIIAKNLSGGMQRRLDIACSLIHNP